MYHITYIKVMNISVLAQHDDVTSPWLCVCFAATYIKTAEDMGLYDGKIFLEQRYIPVWVYEVSGASHRRACTFLPPYSAGERGGPEAAGVRLRPAAVEARLLIWRQSAARRHQLWGDGLRQVTSGRENITNSIAKKGQKLNLSLFFAGR